MDHLFVYCLVYEKCQRLETRVSMVEWTREKLDTMEIEGVVRDNLLATAKSLLVDDPLGWPLRKRSFI